VEARSIFLLFRVPLMFRPETCSDIGGLELKDLHSGGSLKLFEFQKIVDFWYLLHFQYEKIITG